MNSKRRRRRFSKSRNKEIKIYYRDWNTNFKMVVTFLGKRIINSRENWIQ